jgi:hypothetical protein
MTMPGYWPNETGGALAPAVRRYLDGQPLSTGDVRLIAQYLQQWIDSSIWDGNPHADDAARAELKRLRALARGINERRAIDAWIEAAGDFGVDPL